MTAALRGLYAITDTPLLAGGKLLPYAEAALIGGARLLQYRDKSADAVRRFGIGQQLATGQQRGVGDGVEAAQTHWP